MSDLTWVDTVFDGKSDEYKNLTANMTSDEEEEICNIKLEAEDNRITEMLKSGRAICLDAFNSVAAEEIPDTIEEIDFGHDGFYNKNGDYCSNSTNPKYPTKFANFNNLRVIHVCGYYCPFSDEEWFAAIPSLKRVIKEY